MSLLNLNRPAIIQRVRAVLPQQYHARFDDGRVEFVGAFHRPGDRVFLVLRLRTPAHRSLWIKAYERRTEPSGRLAMRLLITSVPPSFAEWQDALYPGDRPWVYQRLKERTKRGKVQNHQRDGRGRIAAVGT